VVATTKVVHTTKVKEPTATTIEVVDVDTNTRTKPHLRITFKINRIFPDQIFVYNSNNIPGAAGRTQSDHRNGTWNQQQQQPNGPNAYF
jgi:hypothetical protein